MQNQHVDRRSATATPEFATVQPRFRKRVLVSAVALGLMALGPIVAQAAPPTCTWNTGTGNWSSTSSWSGCNGTFPGSGSGTGYDVIVANTTYGMVTLDVNDIDAGALTLGDDVSAFGYVTVVGSGEKFTAITINHASDLFLQAGASVATSGDVVLNNGGTLYVGDSGAGDTTLTVGGNLTNTSPGFYSSTLHVGNNGMTSAAAVTVAGALVNTAGSTIEVTGGNTAASKASVTVGGAAPATLLGTYTLTGNTGGAELRYGSGALTRIGDGASGAGILTIDGTNASVDTGSGNGNSALNGLQKIASNGTLDLRNGASVATSGDLAVDQGGRLYVNGFVGTGGGSTLIVGGNLTNASSLSNSTFMVGNAAMTSAATLQVNGELVNTGGAINLTGGSTSGAKASMTVGGAAPAALLGTYNLTGNTGGAELRYGSGGITQIGDASNYGYLTLYGANASVDVGSGSGNSALTGLATIANGILGIYDSASIVTSGGLAVNSGATLDVGAQGTSGSTLTVGGNLTNAGGIQVLGRSTSSRVSVAGDFINTAGMTTIYGGYAAGVSGEINVAGAAPTTLTGSYQLIGGYGGTVGNAELRYGSGGIAQIGDGAGNAGTLRLTGTNTSVDTGAGNGNSALRTLQTIAGNGYLALSDGASVTTNGSVTINGGGELSVDTVDTGGSTLTIGGDLTNASFGSYTGGLHIGIGGITSATTAKVNGDLLNSGYITVAGSNSGAMATVTVDGNANNSGSYGDVYIDAYGKLAVNGTDGYRQTGGTTTVRTNGVLTSGHNDFVGGMLEGDGTVAGFTTIGSGATLRGGYFGPRGTLTVAGDLRVGTGATVASFQDTGEHSEITVSPGSTLELTGGTIQGNASGSLTYTPGQTFNVMNFAPGSLSGVFDGVQNGAGAITPGTSTDLGGGATLGVVYNNTAGNIQLQVVSTPGTPAEIWNGGTGNWTTAGGWSSNAAPMFYSDVTIGNTASGHVTLGQDATIESLLIKSGNTLSISGVATTTLSVGGDVTVNAGGALNMPVGQLALGGDFSNAGTTTLGGKQLYALGSITNSGSGNLNVGTSTIHSQGLSNGAGATITIAGGLITPSSFANAGSLSGFGTIASSIGNSGSIAAGGGTLTVQGGIQGSGNITVGSAARLDLGQATTGSSAAALTLASTGSLNLGSQNLTVSGDYSNANFGTGNSFNKLANVSGTGRIAAAGNVAQAITGSGVSNGATASPTLAFGNVHVGSSNDQSYAIANTGSSGPALRGAVQTSVNGGNLTDASLSGSGVTAANWGPVSTGASTAAYTVTYAPTVAGALNGQAVHIANNFSNVGEQTLTITGTAYAYASPTVASSLSPQYNFGVVQVGQTYTDSLTITNTLVASNAAYQEGLNASFGSSTNSQLTGSGSITNLGAGQSNAGTMMVTLTPVTAGQIGGSIAVNFASNGAGTSGLGITAFDPQNLNYAWAFSGQVVNQANPDITPNPVILASRVGGVATQALAVQNVAGPPPQASLDAQVGTISGAFTSNNASSINQLLAGHTDNTSFVVGLNTATAGHQTGSLQVNLQSDSAPNGCTSDCIVNLSPQTIELSGNVYAPAQATVDTASPIDFGIVHVGDGGGSLSRSISVTNSAPVTALNDSLLGNVTTSGSSAFNGTGTLGGAGLGAGQSSTAMEVTLGTATAGNYTGNADLAFASHDGELADLALAGSSLALNAQVNNYAALTFSLGSGLGSLSYDPTTNTYTLNLGNIAQDAYSGVTSTTLAFVNSGGPAAFTDLLSSTSAVVSGSAFSLSGDAVSDLAGGDSQGGFEIGLSTFNAGFFNELLSFNVNSSNSSGYDMDIGTVYLDLRGSVGATATVPEPGNLAMFVLGLGLLGFFGLAMRRKNGTGGYR